MSDLKPQREIVRIAGRLKEIVTLYDSTGKVLNKFMNPLMLEFKAKDMVQVIVGASLLAMPVAFTEEVWILAETLPTLNVVLFSLVSLAFISTFVYYNYYRREHFSDHKLEFFKRVFATYLVSFAVVAVLITLIDKAPWSANLELAIRRCVLISFPASMSAAVADTVK